MGDTLPQARRGGAASPKHCHTLACKWFSYTGREKARVGMEPSWIETRVDILY